MSDTLPSTQVISITGNSGLLYLSPAANNIRWDAASIGPSIGVDGSTDPTANAVNITIQAQSTTGTGTGGNIMLVSGMGGNGLGTPGNIQLQYGNFALPLATFGLNNNGGDAQMFLAQAAANPTGTVSAGGILYVDSSTGNLMFLGSSGVARTVALA